MSELPNMIKDEVDPSKYDPSKLPDASNTQWYREEFLSIWNGHEIIRARGGAEEVDAWRDNRALASKLTRLFAVERGWIVAKTPIYFPQLVSGSPRGRLIDYSGCVTSSMIDHAQGFKEPRSPWRPAAILSHSYNTDRDDHIKLARANGLAIEFLEWSWYFPQRCLAALYIRM